MTGLDDLDEVSIFTKNTYFLIHSELDAVKVTISAVRACYVC